MDQYGYTSHFIWRDPQHILAWARHPSHQDAFYLFRDRTQDVEVIGAGVMKLTGTAPIWLTPTGSERHLSGCPEARAKSRSVSLQCGER